MRFRLLYRGPLKSNGDPKHKHKIRSDFHHQLQILWQQAPLSGRHYYLLDPKNELTALREVDGWKFVCLVTEKIRLIAELDILMLRPEPPGSLITQGGDIDNRIKTLLDSLRMPQTADEIPSNVKMKQPLYCLLEDDNLITRLNIETDRLLESTPNQSEVHLVISVTTRTTESLVKNLGLGS